MRILHLVPSIGRQSYGLGAVAVNLARGQQMNGQDVSLWCTDPYEEIQRVVKSSGLPSESIKSFPLVGITRFRFSPRMNKAVRSSTTPSSDVLHQHGIWTGLSRTTNQWRTYTGHPTVVTPHGALDPWALKKSAWKKRIALALYEQENLHRASCLHALSIREAESFRRFGLDIPIAVIPNGISSAWISDDSDESSFRRKFGLAADVNLMLYLGRITPKKGLLLLIRSMARIRKKLGNWKLIIAGDDEFNHQAEVEALVEKFEMKPYVQFIGPVFDHDKRDAFAAASIFLLPSYSEGAPIVILEALGAGVPVITTKASPWEELVTFNCGWWTNIDEDALTDALEDALSINEFELRKMGKSGRALVQKHYTWTELAKKTLLLYEWLTYGKSSPPEFVIWD